MARPKLLSDGEVLTATAFILQKLGPQRFTLADVAHHVGLSPSTLSQRFGSKRGLLLAFSRHTATQATRPFEEARLCTQSPLKALRLALVSSTRDLGTRQEAAHSVALWLDELTDDEMRASAAQHASATEGAIFEMLNEAQTIGELQCSDTKALALTLHCAYSGALVHWAIRGTGAFESFLDRVLQPLLPAALPKTNGAKGKTRAKRRRTKVR